MWPSCLFELKYRLITVALNNLYMNTSDQNGEENIGSIQGKNLCFIKSGVTRHPAFSMPVISM